MGYVIDLKDADDNNKDIAGNKAVNISHLLNKGYPVPKGFIITTEAFRKFLEANNLNEQINNILANTDTDNYGTLEENSEKIKNLILSGRMPKEVQDKIKEQYYNLGIDKDMVGVDKEQLDILNARQIDISVALRPSPCVDETTKISYSGFYKSFLFVSGIKGVYDKVTEIWASMYSKESIFARDKFGVDDNPAMAVIVQEMIYGDKSGSISTMNPTNDSHEIYIESSLGSGITGSGEITPDIFVVDPVDGTVLGEKINQKEWRFVKHAVNGNVMKEKVAPDVAAERSLDEREIKFIVKMCGSLGKEPGVSKIIEWVIKRDRVFIVQVNDARISSSEEEISDIENIVEKPILSGLNASKGTNTGEVVKINNMNELSNISDECILVASKITPEIIIASNYIKGIITDEGGANSNTSVLCRELGIPLIVNTKNGYEKFENGERVVIDGFRGIVYRAKKIESGPIICESPAKEDSPVGDISDDCSGEDDKVHEEDVGAMENSKEFITATKVMVEINDTKDGLEEICDGVGLLRAEAILCRLGKHPNELIREGYSKNIGKHIEEQIERFARKCERKPLYYVLFSENSDGMRKLAGGEALEKKETNPKMGILGIRRAMIDKSIINIEMEAIRNLLHKGFSNIKIMVSAITVPSEIDWLKDFMKDSGIEESMIGIGINITNPACAYMQKEFKTKGIETVNIDSDKLAEYVLGIDKEHDDAGKYYNTRHPALIIFIEDTIKRFSKEGITVCVSGSVIDNQDFFEKMIGLGVDTLTVAPDKARFAKVYSARYERKILLDIMRSKGTKMED